MNAIIGSRPSRVWRSIIAVKDVIVAGSFSDTVSNSMKWRGESNIFTVKSANAISCLMANDLSSVGQQSDSAGIKAF